MTVLQLVIGSLTSASHSYEPKVFAVEPVEPRKFEDSFREPFACSDANETVQMSRFCQIQEKFLKEEVFNEKKHE